MCLLKRSLLVIAIVCLNSVLIGCVPTKVMSKTSVPQPYVSPSRKLSNGFATARSNSPVVAINERASRTNLTSENLLNSEEAPPVESGNGNFTTDDVQITMTNEKLIEANLSSTGGEVKPFEDDPVNTANKNTIHSAPSNSSPTHYSDNQPFGQVDTFTSEQMGYNSFPENFDATAFHCNSCSLSNLPNIMNSEQISKCCSIGFTNCCSNSPNSNLNTNINANFNDNVNNINANLNNLNSHNLNSVVTNQSSPQTVSNKNASPQSAPSGNAEFYGTKSKAKQPASKAKGPEQPADENQDLRQYLPLQGYNQLSIDPNVLNSLLMNRFAYANGLNGLGYSNNYNNFLSGLPSNFQYSNINSLNNQNGFSPSSGQLSIISSPMNAFKNQAISNVETSIANNPATSLNSNPSPASSPNPHDKFSRKTSIPNRMGTKTAGANSNYGSSSIGDASVQQSAIDQQQQYGFQSKQQPVHNSENVVQPNFVQPVNSPQPVNIQQAPQQVAQQTPQVPQINGQRINNRNPNEQTVTQQQASQGGISNAFNSFISHIPFIGFNPIRIPVIFSSGSASQPQQMGANQVIAMASQSDLGEPNMQNYQPFSQIVAVRPQSQNAQPINPNQLADQSVSNPTQNQIQNKVTGSQAATGQQQPANSGLVATMFSRPMALYNRLGGYFTRPFGSGKPTLLYMNQHVDPNDPNMQNYLPFYSSPLANNPNLIEILSQINQMNQMNPLFFVQAEKALRDMSGRSARKS